MDNLLRIRLRAVNYDLKRDREYNIGLGRDLFQQWYVVITFGKYNTWGTSKTKIFDTRQEAYKFIDDKLRRRLSSLKRIGCQYQVIDFDGSDDILKTINKKVVEQFSWFGSLKQDR
jgi:hypothetical protein